MQRDLHAVVAHLRCLNTLAFLRMALSDASLHPPPKTLLSRSMPPPGHAKHPISGVAAALTAGTDNILSPVLCEVTPVVDLRLGSHITSATISDSLLRVRVALSGIRSLQLDNPAAGW